MSTTLGKLREYETVFVINPELTDDIVNERVERLKGVLDKHGATLLREDRWGKKKMAYEVRNWARGNFILFHYVAEPVAVQELERSMRNMENVYRFMTTLHGEVHDIEAKKAEVEKKARERAEREKKEAEKKAAEGEEKAAG